MKNRQLFSEYMSLYSELFDKEITPVLSKAYWAMFTPYSDEQMEVAFKRTAAECRFFPKPADILERIQEKKGDKSALAWLEVQKEIGRRWDFEKHNIADPIAGAVVAAMGGWRWMHGRTNKDEPWDRKRFEELYSLFSENQDHLEELSAPRSDSPVRIGDTVKGYMKMLEQGGKV